MISFLNNTDNTFRFLFNACVQARRRAISPEHQCLEGTGRPQRLVYYRNGHSHGLIIMMLWSLGSCGELDVLVMRMLRSLKCFEHSSIFGHYSYVSNDEPGCNKYQEALQLYSSKLLGSSEITSVWPYRRLRVLLCAKLRWCQWTTSYAALLQNPSPPSVLPTLDMPELNMSVLATRL